MAMFSVSYSMQFHYDQCYGISIYLDTIAMVDSALRERLQTIALGVKNSVRYINIADDVIARLVTAWAAIRLVRACLPTIFLVVSPYDSDNDRKHQNDWATQFGIC
jgi:hypothetical protein